MASANAKEACSMKRSFFETIFEAMTDGARTIRKRTASGRRLSACDWLAQEGQSDALDPRQARRALVPEAVHMAFRPRMI